jgi:alkanesulfonate monooxygenase SsuD/methylene tetrahydromethanopterin reductase-like flavin-dependent oxidoreductase (luciferase family)
MIENDYLPLTGNPYLQPHEDELSRSLGIKDLILDARRRLGRPATLDDTWGLLHNIVVAETDQEAARIFRDSWAFGNELMYTYCKIVEEGEPLPDDYRAYAGGMAEFLRAYSYEDMLNYKGSLVGAPDTVVEKLKNLYEISELKNHLMWMNRGGVMKQDELLRSMELFATEVMPRVRDVGETEAPVLAAATANP